MIRTLTRLGLGARRGAPVHDVPVVQWKSGAEGPVVAVTANVHGDETTGVVACRELDQQLGGLLSRGTVVLYPTCNPHGLAERSRTVPPDDTDLNRVFPGSPRGTGAHRLASILWRDIVARKPDLLLDLHSDAPNAIPYVILDRPVRLGWERRRVLGERMSQLAAATGMTVVCEYPDEAYLNFGLDQSLAGAAVNLLGIPALTLEVGPRRSTNAEAVGLMVGAVLAVLGQLEMVPPRGSAPSTPAKRLRRSAGPRARRGGVLVPEVRPGDFVARGAPMCRLTDWFQEDEVVVATEDAVLLAWSEHSWVPAGAVVGTIAVPDGERL